jgi:putative membrane protein
VRLDPRSIPYRAIQGVGQVAALVVFALVFSGGDSAASVPFLLLLVVGVAATVGWQVLYHRRFAYEVGPETFDIQSGVLSRREREIPYDRIHNVDVAQNAVQRFLGIAEVRLETAGGSDTEASLQYVSRAEADRLPAEISQRKRGSESEASPSTGDVLFEMGPRDLAVLGVVSADLRLLGLVAVLGSGFAPALVEALPPGTSLLLATLGPAVAVLALVGVWLVSAVRSVFRYYDFRLTRHDDELRYERGLLQRYNGTIPIEKVQTVAIRENPLARRLGYATLVIETAGYAAGGSASVESAVPIARRERVVELARAVEPVDALDVERPPTRARTRYAARYTLAVLGLVAGAWAVDAVTGSFANWYLALGLLAAVPVAAHLTWIHRGYRADDTHVVTRSGFWRRETRLVRYDRVQTVLSTQSIFQRRRHLASVIVDTAGSGGMVGGDAVAIDIDASTAEGLREAVADRMHRALVSSPVPETGS